MANSGNKNNGNMNDFMKKLWEEFTKPPTWAKNAPKKGGGGNSQHDNGKKDKAGASQSPKKRQPPSWWSWSTSDGVPIQKHKKKQAGKKKVALSAADSDSKAKQLQKQKTRTLTLHDTMAPGSQTPASAPHWQAQFRRHGFSSAVLKPYGLTLTKVEPFGPVLRLQTNQGLIALKKTELAPAHILFLHEAILYMEQQGFKRCAPFLLTQNKQLPYAQTGGDTYYATRWIRGQEADFRETTQLAMAAMTIAEFHEASRGFNPNGYRPAMIFDMADRFQDRRNELVQWKKRAAKKSRPDAVDKLFLAHVDTYIQQSDQALTILRLPEVRSQLLYEEDDPPLCHLDLTPYNMIYTTNRQIALIDFDFATFGPRTLDVAHLMRRAMQRLGWEEDVARHVLINYNGVRILNRFEYRILQGLLLFPHRFWRIAYQHYDVAHDPNHYGFFELCVAEEEKRQAFLTRFGRQVDRMWR